MGKYIKILLLACLTQSVFAANLADLKADTGTRVTTIKLLKAFPDSNVNPAFINVDAGAIGTNTGDGCSLVEAIVNANDDLPTHSDCDAGSGTDTINLPGGTITYDNFSQFQNALPIITSHIILEGNNTILERNSTVRFRFFEISGASATLEIKDATLTGGLVANNNGGSILNQNGGTLILANTTIKNSRADLGGGIYMDSGGNISLNYSTIEDTFNGAIITFNTTGLGSNVNISNSTITNNISLGSVGILQLFSTNLDISDSLISNNSARSNLGIVIVIAGSTTIERTRIVDNVCLATPNSYKTCSGGLFTNGPQATINASEFSGNQGGAIGAVSVANTPLIMSNSTISNNTSLPLPVTQSGASAAALYIEGPYMSTIVQSTIVDNIATGVGKGAVHIFNGANVNIDSSIISNNQSTTGLSEISQGTNTTLNVNYSVLGDESKLTIQALDPISETSVNNGIGNILATVDSSTSYLADQIFDPTLVTHSGTTQTHQLVPLSPADDSGSAVACSLYPTDQRGETRGSPCDMGAHEGVGNDIQLNLTGVILEGSVFNGIVDPRLNASGIIPTVEPYTALGYVYANNPNGAGATASVPMQSDIVDWVVVELRDASNLSYVIESQPALLHADGSVRDLDGNTQVLPFSSSTGDYYISVKHRNHLSVATDQPVTFTNDLVLSVSFQSTPLYGNATDNYSQVYVNFILVNALTSGDANANGAIEAADRAIVWNNRNTIGYKVSDVTLNGAVNASDRSVVWNNKNKAQPF